MAGRSLALNIQTTQIELLFADTRQQLDGTRYGNALEDLEAEDGRRGRLNASHRSLNHVHPYKLGIAARPRVSR